MRAACSFSFNILDWSAISSRISTQQEWLQWSNNALNPNDLAEYQPALDFLPAIQRRRLGKAARLVCQAAWPLAERYPDCPVVFASHDGEINRSFELWPELLQSQTVSPTSFGLSVHNALAGQWSIQRKDMQESTALATLSDGLETALAECYALLQEGTERVLLIIAEDPLKTEYAVQAERAPFPYALAMIIENGENYRLALHISENPSHQKSDYFGALTWIKFMLLPHKQHEQTHGNRTWQWLKQYENP